MEPPYNGAITDIMVKFTTNVTMEFYSCPVMHSRFFRIGNQIFIMSTLLWWNFSGSTTPWMIDKTINATFIKGFYPIRYCLTSYIIKTRNHIRMPAFTEFSNSCNTNETSLGWRSFCCDVEFFQRTILSIGHDRLSTHTIDGRTPIVWAQDLYNKIKWKTFGNRSKYCRLPLKLIGIRDSSRFHITCFVIWQFWFSLWLDRIAIFSQNTVDRGPALSG